MPSVKIQGLTVDLEAVRSELPKKSRSFWVVGRKRGSLLRNSGIDLQPQKDG